MNEQENKDLEDMKAKVEKIKVDFFDYARYISKWSQQDLLTSGYRNMSNAEALLKAFKDAYGKIEKLHREYVTKYPD